MGLGVAADPASVGNAVKRFYENRRINKCGRTLHSRGKSKRPRSVRTQNLAKTAVFL